MIGRDNNRASRNGKPYTRILELDVATQRYSERQWKYQFEEAGHVTADFQMLNATTGLVIERDDATEGAGPNCPNEPRIDCFTRPAKFKRIYKSAALLSLLNINVIKRPRTQTKSFGQRLGRHVRKSVRVIYCPQRAQTA